MAFSGTFQLRSATAGLPSFALTVYDRGHGSFLASGYAGLGCQESVTVRLAGSYAYFSRDPSGNGGRGARAATGWTTEVRAGTPGLPAASNETTANGQVPAGSDGLVHAIGRRGAAEASLAEAAQAVAVGHDAAGVRGDLGQRRWYSRPRRRARRAVDPEARDVVVAGRVEVRPAQPGELGPVARGGGAAWPEKSAVPSPGPRPRCRSGRGSRASVMATHRLVPCQARTRPT